MSSCPSFSSRLIFAKVPLTQDSALGERLWRTSLRTVERKGCVRRKRGIRQAVGNRLQIRLRTDERRVPCAACVDGGATRKRSLRRAKNYKAAADFDTRNVAVNPAQVINPGATPRFCPHHEQAIPVG